MSGDVTHVACIRDDKRSYLVGKIMTIEMHEDGSGKPPWICLPIDGKLKYRFETEQLCVVRQYMIAAKPLDAAENDHPALREEFYEVWEFALDRLVRWFHARPGWRFIMVERGREQQVFYTHEEGELSEWFAPYWERYITYQQRAPSARR